jgi:hypothetical protein
MRPRLADTSFVGYFGDPDFHDGKVVAVEQQEMIKPKSALSRRQKNARHSLEKGRKPYQTAKSSHDWESKTRSTLVRVTGGKWSESVPR